ncbi:ABC transporter permease [Mesorhizobium sp. SP-1A]|uniref:ABC transporter permease n=1 Tax=Mesorhizobium sp. SP-1A TaxID=3077840 RepID=UPI0028F7172B|nr:ABC transporter permease [Mesorhizobium sp. SP-1A]
MSVAAVRNDRKPWFASISSYGIFLVLAAVYAIAILSSHAFLNPTYIFNIVRQAAPVGIAAIGVTYVMILGEVDLSVGAVISAAVLVAAALMNGDASNIPLAIIGTCLMGVIVGGINGFLVAYGRVSSFILTLGTGLALSGLIQVYSGGTAKGVVSPGFREFFNFRVSGMVPVLAIVFLALAVIGALYLRRSQFGRRLYLCGSNRMSATLSGLPVRRTILVAYMFSGFFGALAGLALVARSGVSSTLAGQGLEFQVLAAVVLGGTTFDGGRGNVGGTIAGCLVLLIAFNLVNVAGLSFYAQLIVMGVIIIAASTIHGRVSARST